jgi:hypothetical protein
MKRHPLNNEKERLKAMSSGETALAVRGGMSALGQEHGTGMMDPRRILLATTFPVIIQDRDYRDEFL